MMATTHALVGFLLGAVAMWFGLPGPLAATAAVAGSVVPDLDLYYGHRRTLHYPVLFPIAAAACVASSVLAGGSLALVGLAMFFAGASAHVWTDVLGAGLELRPWEATSERAVYDHVRGRWIAPRRWIPYDGSPADLALAGGLAIATAPFYDGVEQAVIVVLVATSLVYATLRRRLATVVPAVATSLPAPLRRRVPGRYLK